VLGVSSWRLGFRGCWGGDGVNGIRKGGSVKERGVCFFVAFSRGVWKGIELEED
jgi:hypothetical protein